MIDTPQGPLTLPELEALIGVNLDLAWQYRAAAAAADDADTRVIATTLASWRQARARMFAGEAADAERLEAVFEQERRHEQTTEANRLRAV